MRIVYVEDNIANVHLVKRVARMGKHEIINYIDGMDAFNNFETDNPDLVLMDIQLAGELTGIEVVKKLRDQGYETPIFAVTAYAMVGDKERCMEAGCTGYMSKPLPVTELVQLFKDYDKPETETPETPPATAEADVKKADEKPVTTPVTEAKAEADTQVKSATETKAEVATPVESATETTSEADTQVPTSSKSETISEVDTQVPTSSKSEAKPEADTPVVPVKTTNADADTPEESTASTSESATETQETDVPATEPSRETLANTADSAAEGTDSLSEEDTPASVTPTDDTSTPPAKMI